MWSRCCGAHCGSEVTTVVVQARTASTRLPRKVLRLLGGRPVLGWVVRAALDAKVGDVVVATTQADEDDDIVALARTLGVRAVRGSGIDVLSRFLLALEGAHDDEVVVRLTADCPLLDPALVRMAVAAFGAGDVPYLSTVVDRALPRGEDVEVTRAGVLRQLDAHAAGIDRVHVTSALYRDPDLPVAGLTFRPRSDDLRITLDTEEDARLLDELVARIGDRAPSWREVVEILRSTPSLAALNAAVRHKELDEG